jgi:hypothetical protein
MANLVSDPPIQTAVYEPVATSNSAPSADRTLNQAEAKTRQLPYQESHQAELLHLQAETEALLQQLQTLKQQRLATHQAG